MRGVLLYLTVLGLLGVSARTPLANPRARRPSLLEARKKENAARDAERQTMEAEEAMRRRWANESGTDGFRYHNDKTSAYLVESLPDLPFSVGEMYSGIIPLDWADPSTGLFFVYQPTVGEQVDEVTIWLNGGPGCSSLEGFFQETGLFIWQPGMYRPVVNAYSWVNLTNMLWVEYPIGVGFSPGNVTADNEEDIAADFIQFLDNFQDLFGIKNYKIYVTGESYAGRYVPYVASAIIDQNNTDHFNLGGALVYDACIGVFDYVQEEIPTYPFIEANANLLNLNETFMSTLRDLHQSCGYADYIDQYLQFPPSGQQPPLYFNFSDTANQTCDLFNMAFNEALVVNPCFDNTMCPLLWDVLGLPGSLDYIPDGFETVYFNRSDVKAALHAPDSVDWAECAVDAVFTAGDAGPESSGDLSADPIQSVLPKVIEKTNRVLVANGDYDMIIMTNGTLLAIQNMTWNGALGFQSTPNTSFIVELPELQNADVFTMQNNAPAEGAQGVMGVTHYERGLMWAQSYQTGHMQPQYQARSAYKHLQWLLGRIDDL